MSNPYQITTIPGIPANLLPSLRVGTTVINRFSFEQTPTLEFQLLSIDPINLIEEQFNIAGITYVVENKSQNVDLNSPDRLIQTTIKCIDERSQLLDALVDGWGNSEPRVSEKFYIENPIRDMNKATFDLFKQICLNSSRIELDLDGINSIRPFFKPENTQSYRQVLTQLSLLNEQFIDFSSSKISLIKIGAKGTVTLREGDILADPGLQVSYSSPVGRFILNGFPYILEDLILTPELEGYYLEPVPEEITSLRPDILLTSPEGELILRPRSPEFFDLEQREEPFFRAQFFRPEPLTTLELPEFKSKNELLNPEEDEEDQPLEYTIPGIQFCQNYITPGKFIIGDDEQFTSPDGQEFVVVIDKNTPYHYQGGPIREIIEQCFDPRGQIVKTSVTKQGAIPAARELVKINDYYSLNFVDAPPTYGGYYQVDPQREFPIFTEFEDSQTTYKYRNIRLFDLPREEIADLPNNEFQYEREVKTVLTNSSNVRTSVGLALEESDLQDLIATYNSTLLMRRMAFPDDRLLELVPLANGNEIIQIQLTTATTLDKQKVLVDCIRTMAEKLRDGSNLELKRFIFNFQRVEDAVAFAQGVQGLTADVRDARGKGVAQPPEDIYQTQEQEEEQRQFREYFSLYDPKYSPIEYLRREGQIRRKLEQAIELAYDLIYTPSKSIVTTITRTNIVKGSELFSNRLVSNQQILQEQAEIQRLRLALIFEANILDRIEQGFNEHYEFAAEKRTGADVRYVSDYLDVTLDSEIPTFSSSILWSLYDVRGLEQAINDAKERYTEFQNIDKPLFETRIEDEQECRSQATSDLNRANQIRTEIQAANESLRQLDLSIEDEQRNRLGLDNDINLINIDIAEKTNTDIFIKTNQIALNNLVISANGSFESFELTPILENDNDILEQEITNLQIEIDNLQVEIQNLVIQQQVIDIGIANINLEKAVIQANIADLNTELGVVLGRATCALQYSEAFQPLNIIGEE